MRKAFLTIVGPLDYLARVINNKKDYPPLRLRAHVGPLRYYEAAASEFCVYLKHFTGISSAHTLLDIGCGNAVIYTFLKSYFSVDCNYIGVDVHKQSIDWCRRHIGLHNPKTRFVHLDFKNSIYNPGGTLQHSAAPIPLEKGSCDIILLKSVFTHLMPEEVSSYFSEIFRLLKSKGKCLLTFFLFHEGTTQESERLFPYKSNDGHYRVSDKKHPERTIAYDENFIRSLLEEHGLTLYSSIQYGSWSGGNDVLSYQDLLVVEKVNA